MNKHATENEVLWDLCHQIINLVKAAKGIKVVDAPNPYSKDEREGKAWQNPNLKSFTDKP
jgi:hypothetical protein